MSASDAARALGISLDTLRRWDRVGRITVERDTANHRIVPVAEVERLRGAPPAGGLSARNRLKGEVHAVHIDGMVALVELVVREPGRMVALITRDAAEDLELRAGDQVTVVVKSTSVMVER